MAMAKEQTPKNDTPAMRQFRHFKQQYPQCVLFFQMGDFYETFYEDAKLAHKVLGVALTQRTEGVPMAGVPYHAVEGYLQRMIQAGYRVAVCDQVEDPKQAKGVVKRDVTRIITPGTITDETLLEDGRDYPLAAVMFHDDGHASLAWAELSTGAFQVGTFNGDELNDELARIAPNELLHVETADGKASQRIERLIDTADCVAADRPAWQFSQAQAIETLQRQFQVKTLAGFGFNDADPALGPASAIIHYLLETQMAGQAQESARIAHLRPPGRFSRVEHMVIDHVSLRSLEVERTMRTGQTEGSLLGILRDCQTPMGKRTLRQWLCFPLREHEPIEKRQRVVSALFEDDRLLGELRSVFDQVQDVPRIMARIAIGRATPRDLVALGHSAAPAATANQLLVERPAFGEYHQRLVDISGPMTELSSAIAQACTDAPPAHLRQGGLLRDGYDDQLDEYRALQRDGNDWLARYQKQLVDQTGINNLKVGFNKIFGYYIELSAANRDRAPDQWTRKQTLKNAERFITPQLKEYEGKVLAAEQHAVAREQHLFTELCNSCLDYMDHLHELSVIVAELDVLACFARHAVRRRYVCPCIVEQPILVVRDGRHPVLDVMLTDQFVPNDVMLSPSGDEPGPEVAAATLALITGPNMSGKSTYIRQTALIVLLAHVGSFVPASEATIGLCDRIFTRIGASDELHAGRSTFMVEMTETANICHHATDRSLVILDEIGRGTSTLDGLALAWAITEHMALRRCRALFATHYHELTVLSERYDNITNLNVAVREWQDQIVFLHRIVAGATDRSYGIHVAKIAGLPSRVVDRANELLAQLEVSHNAPGLSHPDAASTPASPQLSLFTEYVDHPVVDELRRLDLQAMTPLQAFDTLRELHHRANNGSE